MAQKEQGLEVVCVDGPLFGTSIRLHSTKLGVVMWVADPLGPCHFRITIAESNQHSPYVPARYRRDRDYVGYYVRMRNRDGVEGAWFSRRKEPRAPLGNPVTESGFFGEFPPADWEPWEPEDPADFWNTA